MTTEQARSPSAFGLAGDLWFPEASHGNQAVLAFLMGG